MALDMRAFEAYRRSAGDKTTLARLVVGAILVGLAWLLVTFAVVFAAFLFSDAYAEGFASLGGFMASRIGVLAALSSFAGIWIGLWLVMRFVHRERLALLLGAAQRLSWPGFCKGLAAVLVTSFISEIAIYAIAPGIERTPIAWTAWLAFLLPVLLLTLLQTSAEEVLFRGYLMRGLASRFASPLVWGVLPAVAFTLMHWNAGAPWAMNLTVLATIGSFAALLTLLVVATGNLGAAMGAHFGNNLAGFLLLSHEETLGSFALYRGQSLQQLDWTGSLTLTVSLVGIVSCALTWVLLVNPRSPLRVEPDRPAERPGLTPAPLSV